MSDEPPFTTEVMEAVGRLARRDAGEGRAQRQRRRAAAVRTIDGRTRGAQ